MLTYLLLLISSYNNQYYKEQRITKLRDNNIAIESSIRDLIYKKFQSTYKNPALDFPSQVLNESRIHKKILEIDPDYLLQLQIDLNDGNLKFINTTNSNLKNGNDKSYTNAAVQAGLNVKGFKKSWKKAVRTKQLRYQLNINTKHLNSIDSNDKEADLSFDVEGLISDSLMAQALNTLPLRNGIESAYNAVHSSATSYPSLINALLISAHRAKDTKLLFNTEK